MSGSGSILRQRRENEMKILLTGATKMQARRPRRREYNTSINALYHALVQAKHDVDWRALEYDEKRALTQYDLVILGLGTISEFSCTYLYEMLLASRAENVLYLVNDWKANMTIRNLMEADIFRDFVMKNNTGKRLPIARVKADRKKLEDCREKMFQGKPRLLGPFFEGWGDRAIITKETPFKSIFEFDPSTFYLDWWKKHWKVEIPKVKKKEWVYGALSNYARWHDRLGAKWPIRAFNKKTFIPEEDLVKLYAKSAGMLMPRYKASGSGWWRARYCHAILCENLMYADRDEWEGTKLWHSIEEMEKMTAKMRTDFAYYQRGTLLREMPSWKRTIDQINNVILEVVL